MREREIKKEKRKTGKKSVYTRETKRAVGGKREEKE